MVLNIWLLRSWAQKSWLFSAFFQTSRLRSPHQESRACLQLERRLQRVLGFREHWKRNLEMWS